MMGSPLNPVIWATGQGQAALFAEATLWQSHVGPTRPAEHLRELALNFFVTESMSSWKDELRVRSKAELELGLLPNV